MSFVTRWFKKRDSDDYESVLASLAIDIQKRQTRLSDIRLRERRSTLLVTFYTIALWLVYLGLWYSNFIPSITGARRNSGFEKSLRRALVALGPILILFIRRIVQIWYTRIGDREEKQLQNLIKQQRLKVEEIKKKTNYYSTRNLLERYDESTAGDTPVRRRVSALPQPPTPIPATPVRQPQQKPAAQTTLTPSLQKQLSPRAPPPPLPPSKKQWYDRLADAILGDDDSGAVSAASRYALICEKCFAHNGLVKETMWEDTQYTCPKCGHFNASVRSKRAGQASGSVQASPVTPLSAFSPASQPISTGPKPLPRVAFVGNTQPLQKPRAEDEPDAADGQDGKAGDVSVMEVDL